MFGNLRKAQSSGIGIVGNSHTERNEMKANLGFREQVGLFLGFRGQDWPTLRWMIGASGGNLADVVELLVWRLRDLGRAGK